MGCNEDTIIAIPGLSVNDMQLLMETLRQFPEIKSAIVFGSRAKGNFREGSDVDIAISGVLISNKICSQLDYQLNQELLLPWYFDVVHFESISSNELVNHIQRVGKCFYRSE